MMGTAMMPISTTVAPTVPAAMPKMVAVMSTPTYSEPGTGPIMSWKPRNRRSMSPPCSIR